MTHQIKRSHILAYGTLLVLTLYTIFSNFSPSRQLRTKNPSGNKNGVVIAPACSFEQCCKSCKSEELMNVIVTTKNDSGQAFAKEECAMKINDIIENPNYVFPPLAIALCANDWDALEKNFDIEFIELDSNVYKSNEIASPACSFEQCCKSCTSEELMNVIVTTKNDSGQEFAKEECAMKINDIIEDPNYVFPPLAIALCANDWDALEKNFDIEFIELDTNVYKSNEIASPACSFEQCCKSCKSEELMNVIVTTKNDSGQAFAKEECAMKINDIIEDPNYVFPPLAIALCSNDWDALEKNFDIEFIELDSNVYKSNEIASPACSFEQCCKSCTSEELLNVIVTTKNDSGQEFAKEECAMKINDIIEDPNYIFPPLAIALCANDWDALEKNFDIEFIELDTNVYKSNEIASPACSFEQCCKSCTSEELMNVIVTTKNDSGQAFAKEECAMKINDIIEDPNYVFPPLAIALCSNDWDALEKNFDIEFIELDSNVYKSNDIDIGA